VPRRVVAEPVALSSHAIELVEIDIGGTDSLRVQGLRHGDRGRALAGADGSGEQDERLLAIRHRRHSISIASPTNRTAASMSLRFVIRSSIHGEFFERFG
jgi:hypothetical protein